MKEFIEKYKKYNIEQKDFTYKYPDGTIEVESFIVINGFDGNKAIELELEPEQDLSEVEEILKIEPFVFNDYLAIKYLDKIEVLLSPINNRSSLRIGEYGKEIEKDIINVGMHYYKNDLNIKIQIGKEDTLLPTMANYIKGARRYSRRNPYIIKIENYTKPTADGIESDARNILNSVLFDIEFNYDLSFETINLESLVRRPIRRRRKSDELPTEKVYFVYKNYIPELIQYLHIAEKVDFLPFKFVCYYHILEYFSDKSAYQIVSTEVKKILLKPDFHIKTDYYVNNVINLFKKENDKYTGDKNKIERVLRQFVDREELKAKLSELNQLDSFSKEVILENVKPLKLSAINFNHDTNFYPELTKRIYSIRCSIVHSNPDFDESKAVPFVATPSNLDKLRIEIELIAEIARKIIVDSKT